MQSFDRFLSPSEAARALGVSAKALRLYEQRGLIAPGRSAAGWRIYGSDAMARAGEIVALRALGLSLADVARVLAGDANSLGLALALHQTSLEARVRQLAETIEKIRGLRADLARGKAPVAGELATVLCAETALSVRFELPWPWGGETFELNDVKPINYIIGPLFSGKTRLAKRLAQTLPDAVFLGLDRLEHNGAAARTCLDADPALKARVDRAMAWLLDDGATVSDALTSLLAGLETEGPAVLVLDMVEQGLDHATQEALVAWLRQRIAHGARTLFLTTRSSALLDLAAVGPDEAIIFCPANHSPPFRVAPYPGATGYEAVATCLASPEVRARTEGVVAFRPSAV